MQLSVVIPCFNEEATIKETEQRVNNLLKNLKISGQINSFELIFVDDGSKDDTATILRQFTKTDSNIKLISLSRNFGHQAALLAGMANASGDAVVTLDADLQDPPEVIREMIKKYKEGYELVFGVRGKRAADSHFKRLTGEAFYKLMELMGVKIIFNHADFRLMSKNVLEELKGFSESNLFLRGLIPFLGFNQTEVYYDREARFAGETKYPLSKMIAFAIEGITSFTYLPLRLASFVGIILSIISLLLSAWAIIVKITGRSVPGWTSMVLPMYFLGGIQLLFLGIIGEYLGKIYLETKRRPPFIIKSKENFNG